MTISGELYIVLFIVVCIFFFISFFSMKVGLVLMALAMLFSPEIPVGSIGIRSIVLRMEDVLIPILLLAWLARLSIRREFRLLALTPLNVPILLLLGISLVSTAWGFAMGRVSLLMAGFYLLKTVEFFVTFFLVVNYVRAVPQIKVFLFFALLTVGLLGLYTLTQIPENEIFTRHRITAPFEGRPEPGTVGGYMAFLLLIILGICLYEESPRMKWLCGFLGLIVFIPFLYTLNRTSYAALIAGTLFLAFSSKKKWLVYLLIGFVFTSPFWIPPSVKERIAFTWLDAAKPGRILGVDSSFQERITAYEKMWRAWRFSPLIGWGVTSFQIPDSQYARTLHEIGIIGLGLWLWIFWRLFRISHWLFYRLEGGGLKGMVLGYRAGLIGILLHGFGNITFYIVRIMEPFWFLSGLVVSLYLIKIQETSSVNP